MFILLLHLSAKLNQYLRPEADTRISNADQQSGRKLIWKTHSSWLPDIERHYLQNELEVLQQLNSLPVWQGQAYSVQVPKILNTEVSPHLIRFATELFIGKKLAHQNPSTMEPVLSEILNYLTNIQMRTPQIETILGKRSAFSLWISGLMYGVIAALKNPRLFWKCIQSTGLFLTAYFPALSLQLPLTLAHRDLDADNILTEKKSILLADWENAVLTDPLYDLAQVPRWYSRFLSLDSLNKICLARLKSRTEKQRYTALMIYGALQSLALDQNESHMFEGARQTLMYVTKNQQNSFIETLFLSLLTCLEKVYSLLPGLHHYYNRSAIILCYHDISSNGWQYSVTADEFKRQMTFLTQHFQFKSLTEVLKTKTGLALTFDDGYESVYTTALPILKKLGVSATVFAIGNRELVDRRQLDTDATILSDSQILKLIQNGWEIGFHSQTHADSTQLSMTQLQQEIGQGKFEFDQRIGIKTRYFAYPKGQYSSKIRTAVKKAGFEAAFTVDDRPISSHDDQLLIPRISIENQLDTQHLATYLTPVGLGVRMGIVWFLHLKSRIQTGNTI